MGKRGNGTYQNKAQKTIIRCE